MDYEAAIREVARYPIRGDDGVRRVLVGGGLLLAVFAMFVVGGVATIFALDAEQFAAGAVLGLLTLLVPTLVATFYQGYLIEVMRTTLRGEDELPPWRRWGHLFTEGVKAYAIVLVYQLAIMLVYLLSFVVFFVVLLAVGGATGDGGGGDAIIGALSLFYPIVMVVSMVFSVLLGYFTVISLVTYAHKGSIRAALSPSHLRRVGFTKEFAITFVLGYVGMMIAGNVVYVLMLVVVGIFAMFALQTALLRFFATGYAETLGLDPGAVGGSDRPGSDAGGRRRVEPGRAGD